MTKSGKYALIIAAAGLAAFTAADNAAATSQNSTGAEKTQSTEALGNLQEASQTLSQATGQGGDLKAPRDKASQALNALSAEIQPMTSSGKAQSQAQNALSSIKNAQQVLSQQQQDPKAMASALQQAEQDVRAMKKRVAEESGSTRSADQSGDKSADRSGDKSEKGAQIQVQQNPAEITVEQPAPTVQVEQHRPQVTINQPPPDVTVQAAKPDISYERQGKPQVTVQQTEPKDASSQSSVIAGMRREELVGKSVYGMHGQQAGEVADVVTTSGGQTASVLLDVGGFLGLGEKRISIPAQELKFDGNRISSHSMTAEQIRNMPSTSNQ
jgi:hypothetical protein